MPLVLRVLRGIHQEIYESLQNASGICVDEKRLMWQFDAENLALFQNSSVNAFDRFTGQFDKINGSKVEFDFIVSDSRNIQKVVKQVRKLF